MKIRKIIKYLLLLSVLTSPTNQIEVKIQKKNGKNILILNPKPLKNLKNRKNQKKKKKKKTKKKNNFQKKK